MVRSVVGTRPFSSLSASLCEAIHTRQKYFRLKAVSIATNTPNSQPLMGQCRCFWSFYVGLFFAASWLVAEVKYILIIIMEFKYFFLILTICMKKLEEALRKSEKYKAQQPFKYYVSFR
jgi:hypothetical protein